MSPLVKNPPDVTLPYWSVLTFVYVPEVPNKERFTEIFPDVVIGLNPIFNVVDEIPTEDTEP